MIMIIHHQHHHHQQQHHHHHLWHKCLNELAVLVFSCSIICQITHVHDSKHENAAVQHRPGKINKSHKSKRSKSHTCPKTRPPGVAEATTQMAVLVKYQLTYLGQPSKQGNKNWKNHIYIYMLSLGITPTSGPLVGVT